MPPMGRPWNDIGAFGLQTFLKNDMFPGFHEPGTGLSLGMNNTLAWSEIEDEEMIQAVRLGRKAS